jgi:hypothetical protein
MLWFQPVPWARWLLALLIAGVALYVEFRPDPTVDAPFATTAISRGEVIDNTNTEMRKVPAGLLDTAEPGAVATRAIPPGAPVMSGDAGERDESVPTGWWVVGITLPDGAEVGDEVRLVLLDSGLEVSGVVAHPGSDDPFAAADGGVAVPSESSADVAVASAGGRLAVLISTG